MEIWEEKLQLALTVPKHEEVSEKEMEVMIKLCSQLPSIDPTLFYFDLNKKGECINHHD